MANLKTSVFHVGDGFTFRRVDNHGHAKDGEPLAIELRYALDGHAPAETLLTESMFASVMASVARRGETAETHREALTFLRDDATLTRVELEFARLQQANTDLKAALNVIYQTVRGDEKSECWTIRQWLDERGIFNGDIGVTDRLIESVCRAALSPKEPQP